MRKSQNLTTLGGLGAGAIVGLLVLVYVLFNAWTTVGAGTVKVQTMFGEVTGNVLREGFHFVNPLSSFDPYDIKERVTYFEAVPVPAQDRLTSSMSVTVIWQIDPARTPWIRQNIGLTPAIVDQMNRKTHSLLREQGKSIPESQDLFKEDVQQLLQASMQAGLQDFLNDIGGSVKQVLFADIVLPPVVMTAIVQTKQRQEEIQRERANLQVVEQQAQQQVKQAEAAETAANSNAAAQRTMADAAAYEIEARARAQANANKQLAASITPELIEYERVRVWDGKYPTTMAGESAGMILSLPNSK